MSLDLDSRQRAMLQEMGVRVWQPAKPELPAAPPGKSLDAVAVMVDNRPELASPPALPRAPAAPSTRPVSAPAAPAPDRRSLPGVSDDSAASGWTLGQALALYAEPLTGGASRPAGTRWLVLAEMPASALQADTFHPFEGEAGKLLDNMLRAARLHQAGVVWLAPLARLAPPGTAATGLPAALAELVARVQPDVLLLMGRLAAQALLQSSEPLGRLRGQVHRLHAAATVVTYDAGYLLRSPADKAKAWDDLCLAMRVAAGGATLPTRAG